MNRRRLILNGSLLVAFLLVVSFPQAVVFGVLTVKCTFWCEDAVRFSNYHWIQELLSGDEYGYTLYGRYDTIFARKPSAYLLIIPAQKKQCITDVVRAKTQPDRLSLVVLDVNIRDCTGTVSTDSAARGGIVEMLFGMADRRDLMKVLIPPRGPQYFSERMNKFVIPSEPSVLDEIVHL